MTMTASARPVDGGLRHRVDVNGRHAITTDEPTKIGGTDAGPAPHELLPAMLAACASTMIAIYARARQMDVSELRVDVEYDPKSTPRRVELTIHAPAGYSPEALERLYQIADTCPVKRAFEAGFSFDQKLIEDGALSPELAV